MQRSGELQAGVEQVIAVAAACPDAAFDREGRLCGDAGFAVETAVGDHDFEQSHTMARGVSAVSQPQSADLGQVRQPQLSDFQGVHVDPERQRQRFREFRGGLAAAAVGQGPGADLPQAQRAEEQARRAPVQRESFALERETVALEAQAADAQFAQQRAFDAFECDALRIHGDDA